VKSLPVLTNSHVAAWRTCPRLERLRYAEGYRPREAAGALRFGRALHLGLEAWWKAEEQPLDIMLRAIGPMSDEWEYARASAMLTGYHWRWIDSSLRAVAVEKPFAVALKNPDTKASSRRWKLGGKLDGVVSDLENRHFVLEHKTTAEDCGPGSDYWVRLRLDAQASTYLVGARALGYPVLGVIYDVLRKPAHRPGKGETPDEYRDRMLEAIAEAPEKYYQRAEVVRTEAEELEAARDLWEHAKAIADARKMPRAVRNVSSCLQYGRSCEFLTACTGTEDLETSARFRRLPPDTNEELES
jgi:hypothetical protein